MIFLSIGILLCTLLSLVASVLALSATGHLHIKHDALQAQQSATFAEVQFQSRVTRKVLAEKVLPAVGYREPEPLEAQLEQLMQAMSKALKAKGQA